MWKKDIILAAIASRTLWYARALCHLFNFGCGIVPFLMTDSLSPNITDLPTGTPMYISVNHRSIICSVAILAATNSDENVDVSTVFCFFE